MTSSMSIRERYRDPMDGAKPAEAGEGIVRADRCKSHGDINAGPEAERLFRCCIAAEQRLADRPLDAAAEKERVPPCILKAEPEMLGIVVGVVQLQRGGQPVVVCLHRLHGNTELEGGWQ